MKVRVLALIAFSVAFIACERQSSKDEAVSIDKSARDPLLVIPGADESLDPDLIKKGEVLIAYSDCFQCHREDSKAKGPSFSDIARRYPIQSAYIDLLARKIISGGSGTWGYPVMSAHPNLSLDEARIMVSYILSLEKSNS